MSLSGTAICVARRAIAVLNVVALASPQPKAQPRLDVVEDDVGAALVAFFTRAVFVLPGSHLRLPATAERVLRYAPAAALMAIVVPDLALTQGALSISIENPKLIALAQENTVLNEPRAP